MSVGPASQPQKWLAAAVAPYKAGNFDFNAYFLFKDGKLDCVMLEAHDKTAGLQILDSVTTVYGPARHFRETAAVYEYGGIHLV